MLLLDFIPVFSLLLFYQVSAKDDFTRKVNVTYNPDCDIPECNTNKSLNIIYARAEGTNDSLHYIISTVGPSSPTLLLLKSPRDGTLKIDWQKFILSPTKNTTDAISLVSNQHGGKIEAEVKTIIIFDRIVEYNDTNDAAIYNASTKMSPDIMLKQLNWELQLNSTQSYLKGWTNDSKSFSANSSVSIKFFPFNATGQSDVLPSLPHNANSSELEFNLDSLISRKNGSRFALQSLIIGVDTNVSNIRIKSINDEYAPAVFTTEKVEFADPTNQGETIPNTYHQWRAVAYSTPDHVRKMSTDAKTTNFEVLNKTSKSYQDVQNNRLLVAYFGSEKLTSMNVHSLIISFGQSEDGFYSATNYTSWTSTVGFGKPPVDEFSILIICMLVAGIGCPLLVIILGGIYVTYIRIKRRKSSIEKQLVTNYDYMPIET